MTHKRQLITDEIAEKLSLISGLTVTTSRYYPVTSLPHCTVMVTRDDASHLDLNREVEHELSVDIELIVEGDISAENDLTDLCEQVEVNMVDDPTFDSKARETYLESTVVEYSSDGENKHAKATITYTIFYMHIYTTPAG